MSQLALASLDAPAGPSARWAHDIRNALATVGLHVETLERLSGSRGREIAHAAHLLMSRAAAMCTEAMAQGARPEAMSRRKPFDIARTIVQIANLLRPTVPDGFEIRVADSGACAVAADQHEVFRILFNLVHNAIAIARQQSADAPMTQVRTQVTTQVGTQVRTQVMTHVTLRAERNGATVTVRVADDGPGLPPRVRAHLFGRQQSTTGGSGIGLAIARELAERNGGVLRHAESARGASFMLELIGAPDASLSCGALRSLGKSTRH